MAVGGDLAIRSKRTDKRTCKIKRANVRLSCVFSSEQVVIAAEAACESIFKAQQFPFSVNFDSLDEVLTKGALKGQNG